MDDEGRDKRSWSGILQDPSSLSDIAGGRTADRGQTGKKEKEKEDEGMRTKRGRMQRASGESETLGDKWRRQCSRVRAWEEGGSRLSGEDSMAASGPS